MLLTYFLTLLSYFTFLVLSTPNFSPSTDFFCNEEEIPSACPKYSDEVFIRHNNILSVSASIFYKTHLIIHKPAVSVSSCADK